MLAVSDRMGDAITSIMSVLSNIQEPTRSSSGATGLSSPPQAARNNRDKGFVFRFNQGMQFHQRLLLTKVD